MENTDEDNDDQGEKAEWYQSESTPVPSTIQTLMPTLSIDQSTPQQNSVYPTTSQNLVESQQQSSTSSIGTLSHTKSPHVHSSRVLLLESVDGEISQSTPVPLLKSTEWVGLTPAHDDMVNSETDWVHLQGSDMQEVYRPEPLGVAINDEQTTPALTAQALLPQDSIPPLVLSINEDFTAADSAILQTPEPSRTSNVAAAEDQPSHLFTFAPSRDTSKISKSLEPKSFAMAESLSLNHSIPELNEVIKSKGRDVDALKSQRLEKYYPLKAVAQSISSTSEEFKGNLKSEQIATSANDENKHVEKNKSVHILESKKSAEADSASVKDPSPKSSTLSSRKSSLKQDSTSSGRTSLISSLSMGSYKEVSFTKRLSPTRSVKLTTDASTNIPSEGSHDSDNERSSSVTTPMPVSSVTTGGDRTASVNQTISLAEQDIVTASLLDTYGNTIRPPYQSPPNNSNEVMSKSNSDKESDGELIISDLSHPLTNKSSKRKPGSSTNSAVSLEPIIEVPSPEIKKINNRHSGHESSDKSCTLINSKPYLHKYDPVLFGIANRLRDSEKSINSKSSLPPDSSENKSKHELKSSGSNSHYQKIAPMAKKPIDSSHITSNSRISSTSSVSIKLGKERSDSSNGLSTSVPSSKGENLNELWHEYQALNRSSSVENSPIVQKLETLQKLIMRKTSYAAYNTTTSSESSFDVTPRNARTKNAPSKIKQAAKKSDSKTPKICLYCCRNDKSTNCPTPESHDSSSDDSALTLQAWTQTNKSLVEKENNKNLENSEKVKGNANIKRSGTYILKPSDVQIEGTKNSKDKKPLQKDPSITTTSSVQSYTKHASLNERKGSTEKPVYTAWFQSIKSDMSEIIPLCEVINLADSYQQKMKDDVNKNDKRKRNTDNRLNLQDALLKHKRSFIANSRERVQYVKDHQLREKLKEYRKIKRTVAPHVHPQSTTLRDKMVRPIKKKLAFMKRELKVEKSYQKLEEERLAMIRSNRLKMKQFDSKTRRQFLIPRKPRNTERRIQVVKH